MIAAASTSGRPSIVSAGFERRSTCPSASSADLLATDRLGRLSEAIVVRRLLREPRDLLAVTLDQSAVLAEHNERIALGDDEVAVFSMQGSRRLSGTTPGA